MRMQMKSKCVSSPCFIIGSLLCLAAAVTVASHCTGMQPTPCGTDSSTHQPTPCMNGNTGTVYVTDSYNSPSQCASGFEAGGSNCAGQTNQVACIHHNVSYVTGCGSFSNYQSTYTTNLIAQTTPGGDPCNHGS